MGVIAKGFHVYTYFKLNYITTHLWNHTVLLYEYFTRFFFYEAKNLKFTKITKAVKNTVA